MKREKLIATLKEILQKDDEIHFAYLYGSYASHKIYPKSDIDVAIYLRPSDLNGYIKKEDELTGTLTMALHIDNIDLRILNTLPFLLQYRVIKEGILLFAKDELERVDFETMVMNRFFELKPYLDEYDQMLSSRIKASV